MAVLRGPKAGKVASAVPMLAGLGFQHRAVTLLHLGRAVAGSILARTKMQA